MIQEETINQRWLATAEFDLTSIAAGLCSLASAIEPRILYGSLYFLAFMMCFLSPASINIP